MDKRPTCESHFYFRDFGWIFGGMTPVSDCIKETAPGGFHRQGPDAPSAHRRPGYPLSSCVPAELDSVSPSSTTVASWGQRGKPSSDTRAMPRKSSIGNSTTAKHRRHGLEKSHLGVLEMHLARPSIREVVVTQLLTGDRTRCFSRQSSTGLNRTRALSTPRSASTSRALASLFWWKSSRARTVVPVARDAARSGQVMIISRSANLTSFRFGGSLSSWSTRCGG